MHCQDRFEKEDLCTVLYIGAAEIGVSLGNGAGVGADAGRRAELEAEPEAGEAAEANGAEKGVRGN